MRKLITPSAIVAIVALGWLKLPGSAAPALADKPVRWEYAELHYVVETRGASRRISWITVDEEIAATSWDELAAKLKAPAARKDAQEVTHKLRVFTQLGGDGWELVGQQTERGGFGGAFAPGGIWTFKRRVP